MSDGLPTSTVTILWGSKPEPSDDFDAVGDGNCDSDSGGCDVGGRESDAVMSFAAADESDRLSRIPWPGTTSRCLSDSSTPSALADSKAVVVGPVPAIPIPVEVLMRV